MNIFNLSSTANYDGLVKLFEDPTTDVNLQESMRGFTPLLYLLATNVFEKPKDNDQLMKCLNFLIEKGADIHMESRDGCSPLRTAAIHGYTDVVKRLIELGADPNKTSPKGKVSLIIAAENKHIDTVKYLLPLTDTKHYQTSYTDSVLRKNNEIAELIKKVSIEKDIELVEVTEEEHRNYRRKDYLIIENETLRGVYYIVRDYLDNLEDLDPNREFGNVMDMEEMKEPSNKFLKDGEINLTSEDAKYYLDLYEKTQDSGDEDDEFRKSIMKYTFEERDKYIKSLYNEIKEKEPGLYTDEEIVDQIWVFHMIWSCKEKALIYLKNLIKEQ